MLACGQDSNIKKGKKSLSGKKELRIDEEGGSFYGHFTLKNINDQECSMKKNM